MLNVKDSGFRIQGSGFRIQGSRFRVQGSGFRVLGLPFMDYFRWLSVGCIRFWCRGFRFTV